MKLKILFIYFFSLHFDFSEAQNTNYSIAPFGMNAALFQIYNDFDTLIFFGNMSPKRKDYVLFKNLQIKYPKNAGFTILNYSFLDTFIDYWMEYSNVLRIKENFVYVTWGVKNRNQDSSRQVFIKTNLNGDIENYQSVPYYGNARGDYYKIYMNDDSSFLVGGSVYDSINDQNPPYVYRLSTAGKQIASKKLSFPWLAGSQYAMFAGMDQLPNKNCLIGITQYRFNCNINNMPFLTHLLEVDSNLNTVKYIQFDTSKIYMRDIFIENSNRIFLYGSIPDTIKCPPGFQMGKPYIALIDSTGKLQWEIKYHEGNKLLPFCQIRTVRKISDGNYLATGVYLSDTMVYDTSIKEKLYNQMGLIIKFNTKGEILWSKKYYYQNYTSGDNDYMIEDITELSDKSIVAVGWMRLYVKTTDTSGQRGWILELDSVGNILKKKNVGIGQPVLISESFINIYPNPTEDILQIELNEVLGNQFGYILYNIEGKMLIRNQITEKVTRLPLFEFPEGFYIIKVIQDNKTYAIRQFKKVR